MNEKIEILGNGKDGIVIKPPVLCEDVKDKNLDPNKYVGKIYRPGRSPLNAKTVIDKLPDEYDGKLYYKENYICTISEMPNELKKQRRISNEELILRYVEGKTLDDTLSYFITLNDNCEYINLLEAALHLYNDVEVLVNQYNVYFNDIGSTNVMYNQDTKKFMIVDLDDITYDLPRPFPHYPDDKITKKFKYEGKVKYRYWYWNIIDFVFYPILANMLDALEPAMDEYVLDTLDEANQEKFRKRKQVFQEVFNKPYEDFSNEDIEVLKNKLPQLRSLLCSTGGKRKYRVRKSKKSKKILKMKNRKLRKTRKTKKR